MKKLKGDFDKPSVVEDYADNTFQVFGGIGTRLDGKPIKFIAPVAKGEGGPKRGIPDRKWAPSNS